MPNNNIGILVTTGQISSARRYRDATDCSCVEFVLHTQSCGERLQITGLRKLRYQSLRVLDINFLFENSWTQVKVKTPLKMLSDKFLIHRYLSQGLKFLREEIVRTIFWIHFLPILTFLFIKKIFLWRII